MLAKTQISSSFLKRNFYNVFVHTVFVILLILAVRLSAQNRELQRVSRSQEQITVGESINLAGLISIRTGASPASDDSLRLVLVMSASCPYCIRSVNNWEKLSDLAERHGIRTIGISVDSLDKTITFVDENGIAYPVFVPIDIYGFEDANKIHSIPQTFLVNGNLRLQRLWKGVFTDEKLEDAMISILERTTHKQERRDRS